MGKFIFYKQHNAMDCGPTCLRMIFKYHGKKVSAESLRKVSQYSVTGTSMLGIAEAAEAFGFRTVGAKISFDQLMDEAPLPCILFWDNYHFVILVPSSTKRKIVIADPAKGLITFSKKEFLKYWLTVGTDKGVALMLTPTPKFFEIEEEHDSKVGWGLLSSYLFKYKKQLWQLSMGMIIGSLLQMITPFLTQSIVDNGINVNNLNFIQIILIAQFTLFFAQTSVEFIRGRVLLYLSSHINLLILSDFWIKLMRLPMSFFDTKMTGDIMQRINDHRRIQNFITATSLQTIFSIFNLVVFSVILLSFQTTVFFIFISGSLLYLFWIRIFLGYRRNIDYKRFAISSKENSATMQLIFGMQEIKLNGAEQLKRWEWEGIQASLFKLNFKSLSLEQYQRAGTFFINEGKNLLITYFVAVSVLEGSLTLGAMLAIQYIIGQLNGPVENIVTFTQQAQDAKISLERLNEIHQLEDEVSRNSLFSNKLPLNLNIRMTDISFIYPGSGNTPVLKNINVVLPQGKVTAIVGTSGSGKTTLLKIIQKYYSEYKGEIRLGETNMKNVNPRLWRSILGCVMQDGYIFNDTIERNITIGMETSDFEKMTQACHTANILDFIESLPLGFNTKIGAEGMGLSVGQKQRILIARAVYKNPQFILFDEATNALDANNEAEIMEKLQTFFVGRTVVVVAHRLSTVRNADKIIVLEKGEIVEEGSHNELVSLKGKYFELVRNQLELGS